MDESRSMPSTVSPESPGASRTEPAPLLVPSTSSGPAGGDAGGHAAGFEPLPELGNVPSSTVAPPFGAPSPGPEPTSPPLWCASGQAIVEEMLDVARAEVEATLAIDDRELAGDLAMRAVLLEWDKTGVAPAGQPVEPSPVGVEPSIKGESSWAERTLFSRVVHPLAPRLQLAAALAASVGRDDVEPVLSAVARGVHRAEPARGSELALWLAEVWTFSGHRPPPAILDLMMIGESPHARALAQLLGAAPRRVAELLAAAVGRHGTGDRRAEAASWLLDTGAEPRDATVLCARAPASEPATRLRCLDLAIEARLRGDAQEDLAQLWLERAQLVGELSNGALDAAVSRALAIESDEPGREPRGREPLGRSRGQRLARMLDGDPTSLGARPSRHGQLAALAESSAVRDPHFGPLYLRMRSLCHAIVAGDLAAAAELRLRLAFESPCPVVAACHAARTAVSLEVALASGPASALELREVRDLRASLLELAEIAHERTPSPSLLELVDRAWLRRSMIPAQAASRLAPRGGTSLRWAAHLLERRLGELPRATRLWAEQAAAGDGGSFVLEHLASCQRREHDYSALAGTYQALAASEDTSRCAAVWRCAAGALALLVDSDEAPALLARAAESGPRDPVSRVGLLRLATAAGNHAVAAKLLEELQARLEAAPQRWRYARERAELLGMHLGRPEQAEALFEQILVEDPLDAETLIALGELYERQRKPMLAIAARRRAADLLSTTSARVQQLLAVAALGREHSELEDALSALEQAQRLDPSNAEVQRRLADLYEQLGQSEHAVIALRAELARSPEPVRRLEAQLRLAALLQRLDTEPEAVVAAYLDVLAVEPANQEALAGILAPARALHWWHAILRAFRSAPQTPQHLEILAEALERMESYGELARVRRRQLEFIEDPVERRRRAYELAELCDQRLGDADTAVALLRQIEAESPSAERPKLRRKLEAVLEHHHRHAELAELCEEALTALGERDAAERTRLWLRLAHLRGTQLRDLTGGIAACREVLERDEHHEEALALLDELYEAAGKRGEAIAISRRRAEAATGRARAGLLARVARLHQAQGDLDGAVAAFLEAAAAEPADREIFTALERLCYTTKRWPPVVQLYDTAIAYVEAGALRAYRLLDLYSRKAQVQAQYLADLDGAIESLSRLLTRESNPTAAAALLEAACAKKGSFAPLVEAFERRAAAAAHEPQRAQEALRRAVLLAETKVGDPELVARLRGRLLQLDPSDHEQAAALEAYYRERHQVAPLLALLHAQLEVSQQRERTIELLRRVAEVSEIEARDVDGAVEHYSKILQLDGSHVESLEALGRIYESTERWAELIEVTRRQIRHMEDRSSRALLYFRCGSVMEAKFGRQADAIRYYEAAIKASPSCMPAVHGLRDLYRRCEEWPKVVATLELELRLWEDEKERAGVLAQIGQVYAERIGDARRARQYFHEALAVDPECAPANWALFEAYFAAADWERAKPLANALTQKAMRDGEPATRSDFYHKRGVVFAHTGDPRGAADSFVVALEIRPTNLEALEALLAVARTHPDAYEFETMYRELDKVYRRRDDSAPHLARVWIGLAALAERAGDLDASAELSSAAISLAPDDLTVVLALVDLHCDMRRWREAVDTIAAFLPLATPAAHAAALLRQAEIHGDGELETARALAVLDELLAANPSCHRANYLAAQYLTLESRHAEARQAIERAVALVESATGETSARARYRFYRGRVLDALGDTAGAGADYQAASELDLAYAPPVLLLARRVAAEAPRRAEALLIEAARQAIEQAGVVAAVPLQRGLAQLLLAAGDRTAAIEAYRGILAVVPDLSADRVALAEIYADEELPRAITELRKVIERDLHHAPAYRLLATYFARSGAAERAARVHAALDVLGLSEESDRVVLQELRSQRTSMPLVGALRPELRTQLLATRASRDLLGEVWAAFAPALSALLGAPYLGENLRPLDEAGPPIVEDFRATARLLDASAEVLIGDRVPGLAVVTAFPHPLIVLDRTLATEQPAARRFFFGWALDAIRGGYAALLALGAAQRRELTSVMRALLQASGEPQGVAAEVLRATGESGEKVLAKYAGRVRDLDVGGWMDGMVAGARRSGLLACNDLSSAIWMIARLAGESLPSYDATRALGAVLGGPDLIRYFIGDDYQRLRDALAPSQPRASERRT